MKTSELCCVMCLSWLGLGACGKEEPLVFPEGLEPLEAENQASFPEGESESLDLVTGTEDDITWVHGRAWLHTDPTTAWASLRDPEVYLDLRTVSEYSVEELDEPGFDYAYLAHSVVPDILEVEFDTLWVHGAIEGSVEEPSSFAARWEKVDGTEFILLMQGSILVTQGESEDRVMVEIIYHLDAYLREEEEAVRTVENLFADWRASVHGEAVPATE